jgi:hypothetical protein
MKESFRLLEIVFWVVSTVVPELKVLIIHEPLGRLASKSPGMTICYLLFSFLLKLDSGTRFEPKVTLATANLLILWLISWSTNNLMTPYDFLRLHGVLGLKKTAMYIRLVQLSGRDLRSSVYLRRTQH